MPQERHNSLHFPRKVSSSESINDSTPLSRNQTSLWCPNFINHCNIVNDYVVLPRTLGSGRYGTVRECLSRKTARVYAVKSIQKSRVDHPGRVQNEIGLLSQVNHPSIIKIVDCYEDEHYVHIVTENCTGGELFDKIIENVSDTGCFSERSAARIIKSLLQAADCLHSNGIVHRDIKPENIVFESDHDCSPIRLIDFGLARRHWSEVDGPMYNRCGTVYFMSPEVVLGLGYDKSTDTWSIGIIAYLLLCGYPPFNGITDADIYEAIKSKDLRFHPGQWSDKSPLAKCFICTLLRKNPKRRLTAKEALIHPWIQLFAK